MKKKKSCARLGLQEIPFKSLCNSHIVILINSRKRQVKSFCFATEMQLRVFSLRKASMHIMALGKQTLHGS